MTKPRRSVLFMPASNPRAIDKARSLAVDTIILDMEDSVHRDHKEQVRVAVTETLRSGGFGYREVLVRINALDTPYWRDDLAALRNTCADGVVVPKVESLEQLEQLVSALGVDSGGLPVWIMLESAAAVLNARALCAFGPPLAGMLVGTADLSRDLGIPYRADRFALQHSLSACLLAARAAGIVAIDGVFMAIHDGQGLAAEALQGMQLGFDGKSLIHPAQLNSANEIFAPNAEEQADNLALIEAWHTADTRGEAVCVHQGRLVESLHVEQAQARVDIYHQIRQRS